LNYIPAVFAYLVVQGATIHNTGNREKRHQYAILSKQYKITPWVIAFPVGKNYYSLKTFKKALWLF